jgi:hypothetical protein
MEIGVIVPVNISGMDDIAIRIDASCRLPGFLDGCGRTHGDNARALYRHRSICKNSPFAVHRQDVAIDDEKVAIFRLKRFCLSMARPPFPVSRSEPT